MYPNQLYPILERHFRDDKLRKKSIYVEGASGIGKSAMAHLLASSEQVELRDKRFSQMDAVDLIGVPRPVNGYTSWSPPDWLQFEPDSRGILLMDEVTSSSREVFAASYQLFLDRGINGANVPDGWMIIALGNRISDRGVINQMPSPLLNRFVKLTCEPHLDSWRDVMAKQALDPRMIAWVSHQPQYLHNFNPELAANAEPFCSPRSIVSAADYIDWDQDTRVEMFRGCLGKEGASNLESFLRLYTKLPSRAEVEADPLGCHIPADSELGERYAMSMMCSSAMDRTNFDKLWQYVIRMGNQFVVLAVRLALARDNSLATARGFREFADRCQAVFNRS